MEIYSTIDSGRTHIAADQYYQGSVNSYNNCFTKFLFKTIFRKAIDVEIAGQTRCLNKKSYVKLLSKMGSNISLKQVHDFKTLNNLNGLHVIGNQGFMRDKLTASTVNALSKKLIQAVALGSDQRRIEILLGKGGDPNKFFWLFNHRVSSSHYTNDVPYHATTPAIAKHYSAFLVCVERWGMDLKQRMVNYGATTAYAGRIEMFTRSIVQVDNPLSMDFVASIGHGRRGRPVVRPGVRVHQEQHVHFNDHYTNVQSAQALNNLQGFIVTDLPRENRTVAYTRKRDMGGVTMVV